MLPAADARRHAVTPAWRWRWHVVRWWHGSRSSHPAVERWNPVKQQLHILVGAQDHAQAHAKGM
eukprot:COSAG01_NODE_39258_length_479_cov_0.513158_1_plen_63_part_01